MENKLINKKISVLKIDGSSVEGMVTNENHVFIIMKAIRKIVGGTMESEEAIPKVLVESIKIIE